MSFISLTPQRMHIRELIQALNRYLFYLGAIPLVLMMVITVIDVSGRYFRRPLPGTMEISELCLVLIVVLTLAHTQARKGHIDVDLVFDRLPPRVQRVTKMATSALSLVSTGFIAWGTIPWILFSKSVGEWTSILHLSVWMFKATLLLGVLCLCLRLILDIVDYSKGLNGSQV